MQIRICGRNDVPHHSHLSITHIISIGGIEDCPDISAYRGRNFTFHRFSFDDINEIRDDAVAPSYETIKLMIETYKSILYNCDNIDILFHCQAGRNRSSAAAFIFLTVSGWKYEEAMKEIHKVRGPVAPNLLMIKWADQILDKNGEMRDWARANFNQGDLNYRNYKFD